MYQDIFACMANKPHLLLFLQSLAQRMLPVLLYNSMDNPGDIHTKMFRIPRNPLR